MLMHGFKRIRKKFYFLLLRGSRNGGFSSGLHLSNNAGQQLPHVLNHLHASAFAHRPKGYSNLTPHPAYGRGTAEKAAASVHTPDQFRGSSSFIRDPDTPGWSED